MKYQVTFINPDNKYRPITVTIIPRPQEKISSIKKRAVQKACADRHWTSHDLMYKYNYTRFIYRPIDDNGNPIFKKVKED